MANENQNNQNTGQSAPNPASAQSASELKDIQRALKQLVRDGADFNDIVKDQVNELKKLQTGYDKVRSSIEGFRSNSLDVKKIQSDINDQMSKQFINAAKLRETERALGLLEGNQYKDALTYESRLAQSQKRKLNSEKELLSLNQKQEEVINANKNLFEELNNSILSAKKEQEDAEMDLIATQSIQNSRVRAQEEAIATARLNEAKQRYSSIESIKNQEELLQKSQLDDLVQRQKEARNIIDLEEQNYEAIKNNLTPLQAEYIARSKSKEVISLTVKDLQTQLEKEKQIQSSIGLTGKTFENFSKKLGMGNEVYEAMVRRSRELQIQNTAEFKEDIKRKNDRIAAINEVRKAQGKKPIALIEVPKAGVFAAGFKAFKTSFADSWKNDPLFRAGLFLGAAKALNSALQGTIKMFRDGMIGGMKAIGGELADGPIQNLTKPISGFLEKIPLVGGLLGGLVDIMSTFMDYAMNANSQFVKMGRELGLDANEAQNLANNFSNVANSTNDVFINSKKLYEAQIGLSKQLGTTSILSNEILSTNIRLKDVLGLEEDIQASIAQTSVITGKESKDIVGNVLQQVENLKKAGLATQDYKAVLKEVSNLGGYLGLTFAKYPEKLTKAVLQTKAMGLELKQLDAMADSFLDYESSISKEMEAQLLTGKDINLNKAREAFLNNDLTTAAQEITKQVGSAEEFLGLNRIAAESMASSFGMTRDTMADMLKKQEFLSKIGAKDGQSAQQQYELAKKKFATMKDITTEQEKQQYQALASGAANERLAALIEKIKQGFTDLISNSGVSKFIDKAINFMSNPNQIQGFVNGLKDFFATVLEGIGTFVNGASKIANLFLFGKDEIAEDYGDTIKSFGQNLRSQSLGQLEQNEANKISKSKDISVLDAEESVKTPKNKKISKLDDGGFVQTSGIAEVHSGETYLGANSLQFIKMTTENSRKTVELLAKLVTQKSDVSKEQVRFVTGNVILDGVPTGKLMLNSFENNSYTNFDTTRYNS